jgi:hypothetical protein
MRSNLTQRNEDHECSRKTVRNSFAIERVSHREPCWDRRIRGGLAKNVGHISSRRTVCFDVVLHLRSCRCAYVASFSLRRCRLSSARWVAVLPRQVSFPRRSPLPPIIRRNRPHRFLRLPLSSQQEFERKGATKRQQRLS